MPDPAILRSHLYALRKILVLLGEKKYLFSLQRAGNYDASFYRNWCAETRQKLYGIESKRQVENFDLLDSFIRGGLKFGCRQKGKTQRNCTAKSVRLYKKIWALDEAGTELKVDEIIQSPPSQLSYGSPAQRICEDDDAPSDVLQLSNSSRTGQDAKFHARRMFASVMLGDLVSYDHKETYTPIVAAYLLSQLSPQSSESKFAVLSLLLGRRLKEWKGVSIVNQGISMMSIQHVDRDVDIDLPKGLFGTDFAFDRAVSVTRFNTRLKSRLKKTSRTLGSRISVGGLARFGVARFHGGIGVIQSEQLQGKVSKGRITVGYGALAAEDFQRAFDKVLGQFLNWIVNEASYVGEDWKDWARGVASADRTHLADPDSELYGSTRLWTLEPSVSKAVNRQLRDSHACVLDAVVETGKEKSVVDYVNLSARALNLSYMLITGARPLTSITRVAMGSAFVVVADKRFYGKRLARVLAMPTKWIKATRQHLSNIQALLPILNWESGSGSPPTLLGIAHPFLVVERNRHGAYSVTCLTQAKMASWISSELGLHGVAANGLRHAKATEMLKQNLPDSVVANVLGHERGAVDGVAPYLGSAALVETPNIDAAWVPNIKYVSIG